MNGLLGGETALSRNPLRTRDQVRQSLLDLLAPLENHAFRGGYHLGAAGARHSPAQARMEGLSRTLWGVSPLLAGGGVYPGLKTLQSLIRKGLDPDGTRHDPSAYWGIPGDRDQRLVELAALAFSLLTARKALWDDMGRETLGRFGDLLSVVQKREYPPGNWLFFRMMTLFALRQLGLPVDEDQAEQDMVFLDNCYRGEGWFEDGPGGAFDCYNPWGFHFYGLLYNKFAGNKDPERAQRYLEAARFFLANYAAWFREDGSVIPYGRSLTYRFASVAVFSACAFTEQELLPWAELKGLALRNLRYWFSHPVLDNGGILSVGYTYPNPLMAEPYNSPGSPYWALKAYLILALGEDHPFWRAEEAPLPDRDILISQAIPGFVISRTKEDAFLLAAGQKSHASGQEAAKYNKFAYSARFGFSVSQCPYSLELCGADSTLLLSDSAEGIWRECLSVSGTESGAGWTSRLWKPWPDVIVHTVLLSLGDSHVRVHRVQSSRPLHCAEGGFSISRCSGDTLAPPEDSGSSPANAEALAAFPWGASRIAALEPETRRRGRLVFSPPNLNIVHTHGVVPVLEGHIFPGETILISAVRAGGPNDTAAWIVPAVEIRDGRIVVSGAFGECSAPYPAG